MDKGRRSGGRGQTINQDLSKKFIHPYKYERGVNVPTLPLENSKGVDPGGVVYLSGGEETCHGSSVTGFKPLQLPFQRLAKL